MTAHLKEISDLAESIYADIGRADRHDRAKRSLDEIIQICASYANTGIKNLWPSLHLSPIERRILDRLFHRPGERVTYAALLNAAYFDKPDGPPDHALPVFISRLRQKLAGTKYSIPVEKQYHLGYQGLILEDAPQLKAA